VICESTDNLVALGFSDANGNFTAPTTASRWRVNTDSQQFSFYGYLRSQDRPTVDTATGSVTVPTMAFRKGTALIYGRVKDDQNHPLAGVQFYSSDNNNQYEGIASTDQNGNYAIAVKGGAWNVSVDSESPGYANYVFTGGYNITLNGGQAVLQDFVAKPAPYHITGYVRNNNNEPIAGVDVWREATINGTSYRAFSVTTDDNGYYSNNVANGTWRISPACDGDQSLSQLGYQWVSEQQVSINNNNGAANFVAQPPVPLRITTTSLPNGTGGALYTQYLNATGGQPPYNWSLALGSAGLPPVLSLNSSGLISGTPGASGTFNFIVNVTDASFASANRLVEIILYPQPTLSSPSKPSVSDFEFLVNGLAGQNYTIQVSGNFMNWTSIQLTNAPSDTFSSKLGNLATDNYRFYRVMVGP